MCIGHSDKLNPARPVISSVSAEICAITGHTLRRCKNPSVDGRLSVDDGSRPIMKMHILRLPIGNANRMQNPESNVRHLLSANRMSNRLGPIIQD